MSEPEDLPADSGEPTKEVNVRIENVSVPVSTDQFSSAGVPRNSSLWYSKPGRCCRNCED